MKNPRTVVVIDDDSMMREMLRLILNSENYEVIGEAANGESGIALCSKLNPDLVLLDINMPVMDGLQALGKIRAESPAAKVMMVSAEATMDRVREAMTLGASGFVVKPLNAASVLDRVGNCFKGRDGNGG